MSLSLPSGIWESIRLSPLSFSLPIPFSLKCITRVLPESPSLSTYMCCLWQGPILPSSISGWSDCLHYLNIHPHNTRLLWLRHWSHCLHFQTKNSYGTCFLKIFSKVWRFSTFKIYSAGGWEGFLKYDLVTRSTFQHCITLRCGKISLLVLLRPKCFS